MKKLLLSLVCVLGLLGGLRAQEETISIGSGNSSSYRTPINTDQPYSVSQQIYSADEIGKGAGKISKIAFRWASASAETRNLSVYMQNTTQSSFGGWIPLTDNDGKRKNYYLHRIIYESVTSQPIPDGMQVNHLDENKTNNHISNLNLMTHKENNNWGTRNERVAKANTNNKKLSKVVAQYDKDGNLIQVWPSASEVERQLSYDQGHISKCCRGERKTHTQSHQFQLLLHIHPLHLLQFYRHLPLNFLLQKFQGLSYHIQMCLVYYLYH